MTFTENPLAFNVSYFFLNLLSALHPPYLELSPLSIIFLHSFLDVYTHTLCGMADFGGFRARGGGYSIAMQVHPDRMWDMSSLATPSRNSWWLWSLLKALASHHIIPPLSLSCILRSSEAEQSGSRQWLWDLLHSSFLPAPLASYFPTGFGLILSGRSMTVPLPFLAIS